MQIQSEQESRVGLHIRLAAIAYDSFLLAAVLFLATLPITLLYGGALQGQWWFRSYLLVIAFLFFAWFWIHGGQTLGMRAWRIRVQSTDGNALSWRACAIRFAVALLSWSVFGLGFLWSLWDRQSRCWHDMASSSRLLRLPRSGLATGDD